MKKVILVLLLLAALAVAWLYWQPAEPAVNSVATVSNVVKKAPVVPAKTDSDDGAEDSADDANDDASDTASDDDAESDTDTAEEAVEGEVFVPEQPLAEVEGDVAANAESDGEIYELANNSRVEWRGTKVGGAHNGYVPVTEGKVVVDNGNIVAGTFSIALDQIKTTDIDSEDLDNKLKGWFNASEYPVATFDIVEVGSSSVQGNMTINGITKTITFPAVTIVEDDIVIANAEFALDRNEWNVAGGTPAVSEFMELSLSLTWSKQ